MTSALIRLKTLGKARIRWWSPPRTPSTGLSWTSDGCLRLETLVAGFDPRVDIDCVPLTDVRTRVANRCFQGQAAISSLRYLDSQTIPCDAQVQTALWGWAAPTIGWLCLGDRDEDQYGPVTFAAPHQDGHFLIAVDATTFTTPILYTPDGLEWGDPPFDAPYAMVSQQCAAAGPWEKPPRGSLLLWVVVDLDPALSDDAGSGLRIDAGTGPHGFGFSAFEDGAELFEIRPAQGATTIDIGLFDDEGGSARLGTYPLPGQIIAELASGWSCTDAPLLTLTVDGSVVDGVAEAVTLGWMTSVEGAATVPNYPGLASDRAPGTPCPATGDSTVTARPVDHGQVLEGSYRIEVADALRGLGPNAALLIEGQDGTGYVIGLRRLDTETAGNFGVFLFPGGILHVGLTETETETETVDDTAAVPIPDLPENQAGPWTLVVTVTGFDDVPSGPVITVDHVRLTWEPGRR